MLSHVSYTEKQPSPIEIKIVDVGRLPHLYYGGESREIMRAVYEDGSGDGVAEIEAFVSIHNKKRHREAFHSFVYNIGL